MKRHPATTFAFALAMLLLVLQPSGSGVVGQRRKSVRRAPAATRSKPVVNYSRFSHSTKAHQENCKTCHEAPTSNWRKVRDFPDVADYPGHDACVRCHRPQFFKGAQPPICTVCHTKVSPRHDARFAFPIPPQYLAFNLEFPHDKHQDVIASRRVRPSSIMKSAHAVAEDKTYNNCSICHGPYSRPFETSPGFWSDGFVPSPDFFKAAPRKHDACFNCHWNKQEPVRDNCGGCHKLAPVTYRQTLQPFRISMKFSHEGGGEKKNHVAECTTCHINITRAATLRGLRPDVPITGCTECHNKEGLRQDLNKELGLIDKDRAFVCVYCHTSNIGKRDPPASHYAVAERQPLKRTDLK